MGLTRRPAPASTTAVGSEGDSGGLAALPGLMRELVEACEQAERAMVAQVAMVHERERQFREQYARPMDWQVLTACMYAETAAPLATLRAVLVKVRTQDEAGK